MKKIAVMEDFLTPEHRKRVLAAAEKHGFAVDFYGRGAAPARGLEQYEIIYGWCNPQDLKRATGLKWYCCGFAGVDQLSDDSLYASPDVVLSNSSGAYGLTISEHILMVTLMLLRRMPEFQDIVRRREWVSELPMRSIYGSRITVLGAGDIGTNFARRAKALGAAHICGVSRSGRNGDPAYDRMLPQQQLDQVLQDVDSQGNVIAPVSGTLVSLSATENGYVSASMPVAVINGAEQMKITVSVSEALVPKLAIGDQADVAVSAAGAQFSGTVRSVEKAANMQTQLYTVTLSVPAEVSGLLSGMFAEVTFHTDRADGVITVPSEAILTSGSKNYVFVVEDGKAKYVEVTQGLMGSGVTQITSGLTAGQELVTVGQSYLSDGDPVRVVSGEG